MSDAPLMVSVSGLRGWVGQSLTPEVAARFAAAFGSWLRESTGQPHPHVVFGRDSRPSGAMVERAATAGLLATGCRVTTLGIVTTPSVAIMIDHLHADGGMVATASHNPIQWNGLKPLNRDGVAPPPEQARQIIERFHTNRCDYAAVEKLQPVDHDDTANRVHVERLLKHIDAQAIRNRKPKVVLDSVHGAGGPATAMLMEELGVELVHLFAQTTGQFPHTPEPTRENLVGLSGVVREHHADIGMAQDPDADRLALVDERGRYIGEEYTLALAAMHVMGGHPGGTGAANLSTSRMIDDIAATNGGSVYRTPVGEANVAAAMRRHQCIIGGEGNGGVIWPVIAHVRDSLTGIALVLELLATTGKSVGGLVASIPAYAIVKDKLPIQPGMAERTIAAVREKFAGEKIDEQDGIRVDLAEGWVHVRPSNTEPIMRIIAEAADEKTARRLIDEVRRIVGR
ncbi:MAG: phosphoglucosamine mutase [Phycisphaeraceae bacterium]